MFSDHDSGSHLSMMVLKALGPNAGRSKVADAGARPHQAAVSRASRICR
ncbi:Uncharacterised protein [Mycobacterium tuberculosis]|nr:Uncharacterised protein [Mycobacterium tuberculosis]